MTPFHTALAARRDRYNAQFRAASLTARQLDAEAMLTHLRESAGPAVDAAAAAGGDPVAVTDALVDLSLALAARGRLGMRDRPPVPAVAIGFGSALPALGLFVAAEPRRVVTAVLNALHHLAEAPAGHPDRWVRALIEVSGVVTSVRALLDAGVLAAWRCGLARLRSTALTVASTMDPGVRGIALGTSGPVDDVALSRLSADPWLDPASAVRPGADSGLLPVRRVGAFRGFGGVFAEPPSVHTADGRWYATDGTGCWQLHADRFGAALTRVSEAPPAQATTSTLHLSAGQVLDKTDGATLMIPELTEATTWAANDTTLAATTPWTHSVLFIARTPHPTP